MKTNQEPAQPFGRVTVVRRPEHQDQHFFYPWPHPPYLDNAAECHTVYTHPAPAVAVNWLPMETAPKDGTMCRLLVEFEENGLEDSDTPTATIGFNTLGNNGEDFWHLAGWNWCHDEFTQGTGEVIGWLPLLEPAVAVNEQMLEALKGAIRLSNEAYQHWDNDNDSKVGKILAAMAGWSTNYHDDANKLHDAIAAAEAAKKGGCDGLQILR